MSTSNDTTRICKTCLQELPLTDEFFYKHTGRWRRDCKTCHSIKTGHKPNKKYPKGYSECSTCRRLLPLTDEYFMPYKARKRGFRYQCRECNAVKSNRYYHGNKDKILQKEMEKRLTNEDYRIKKLEYSKRYAKEHPADLKAYNQQWQQEHWSEIMEYKRQWKKNNPDKVRFSSRVYKIIRAARIRNNGGKTTSKELKALYDKVKGTCYWCGIDTNGTYEIDHIVPVSKGGGSAIDNLCISCKKCNRLKSNLTMEQWIIKLQNRKDL